jgi:hypothetical protein
LLVSYFNFAKPHNPWSEEIGRRPLAQESGKDRRHQREDDHEMKSVHAHGSVAVFTPRAFFADNAADHNREIGRTASMAKRAQLLGSLANTKGACWPCVGVRFPFDKIVVDISVEFITKHVSAIFPKSLAARRPREIRDHKLSSLITPVNKQPLTRASALVGDRSHRYQGFGTKGQKIGMRMLAAIQRRILSGAPIFGKSEKR